MTRSYLLARLRFTQGNNLTFSGNIAGPRDYYIEFVVNAVDAHEGWAHVVPNRHCDVTREVRCPHSSHLFEDRPSNSRIEHRFKTIRPHGAQIPLAKCGTEGLDDRVVELQEGVGQCVEGTLLSNRILVSYDEPRFDQTSKDQVNV